jgi:hypothetical protein
LAKVAVCCSFAKNRGIGRMVVLRCGRQPRWGALRRAHDYCSALTRFEALYSGTLAAGSWYRACGLFWREHAWPRRASSSRV